MSAFGGRSPNGVPLLALSGHAQNRKQAEDKAKYLKTTEPTSLDGIEKYLGSGMIRGIGPVYAKKLVRAFGEKVFALLASSPESEAPEPFVKGS